jgi:hypothetical protein
LYPCCYHQQWQQQQCCSRRSSNPFNVNTTSSNALNSSTSNNSTSIIEGGWGQDELREQGQQDGEEDVETQAWIVLELCDGTLDTAARNGQLSSSVSGLACVEVS